jgi:hypothetical protein
MLLVNVSTFSFIESTGRRPLIVVGTVVLTGFLVVMGVAGCVNTAAAKWVVVVVIFLWYV